MSVLRQQAPQQRNCQSSDEEGQRQQPGGRSGGGGNRIFGKQQESGRSQPNQDYHTNCSIHENRHRRMHGGDAPPFGMGLLISNKIVDPADVSADRARGKKIEKHADQIVTKYVLKGCFDADRSGQSRPSHRADALRHQINRECQCNIRKLRRREGVKEPLDVDTRKKIRQQAPANEKLDEKDDDGFGLFHPSSDGSMSTCASFFSSRSTKTVRPTIWSRPSA